MILQNNNGTLERCDGGMINNSAMGQGYGTCSTAESTTAKVATLANYEIVKDGVVAVRFTNAVPANSTLNINSKGAKPIYYKGTAIPSDIIRAGDTATFFYDGNYYHVTGVDRQMEFNFSTHAAMNAAITAGTVPNGAICHTDKTDYEVVGGVAKPIIKHGENLLDNWYFVGGGSQQGGGQFPINQRNGRVTPKGTVLYTDTSLTTIVGNQSEDYHIVTYVNDTYCAYPTSTEGITFYTKTSDTIPGYTGNGYGIDRWIKWRAEGNSILTDNGLEFRGHYFDFCQPVEKHFLIPGKYTASILLEASDLSYLNLYNNDTGGVDFELDKSSLESGIVVGTCELSEQWISSVINNNGNVRFGIGGAWTTSDPWLKIKAVKLELGTEQTLAHQDAQGNWVLNDPPPNFQQELAKCQRYQVVLNGNEWDSIGEAVCYTNDMYVLDLQIPVPLRTRNPAVLVNSQGNHVKVHKSISDLRAYTLRTLTAVRTHETNFNLDMYLDTTDTPIIEGSVKVRFNEDNSQWIIDANL